MFNNMNTFGSAPFLYDTLAAGPMNPKTFLTFPYFGSVEIVIRQKSMEATTPWPTLTAGTDSYIIKMHSSNYIV